MKKQTILHMTSSLRMGGAETVLYNIITHLPEFHHEVLYVHPGPFVHKLRDVGVQLHQVHGVINSFDPTFFVRVVRLVKKIQPDVIHSLLWLGNCAGILAGRWLNIPTVSVFHNNVDQNGWLRNAIDGFVLPSADALIAVSDQVRQSVYQQHPKLQKKIHIVRNGIDCGAVQRENAYMAKVREQFNIEQDAFVFGSVGRFEPVKRYDYLIEAFAQVHEKHPNTYLVLVGSGSCGDALKVHAQRCGVANRVIFIEGQRAIGYYSLFDCFVQSSAKEGVSMALLEAMSLGLPCVVTNESMDHPVIMHEKDGILVPAYDKNALVAAMVFGCLEKKVWLDFAKNAVKTAHVSFGLNTMVAAYRNFFKRQAM